MLSLVFKDVLNEFLRDNALYISLGLVALIIISVVTLLVMNRKKN